MSGIVNWSASMVAALLSGATVGVIMHVFFPDAPGWAVWAVMFLTFDIDFRTHRLRDLLR
jgi:hypothetical protein